MDNLDEIQMACCFGVIIDAKTCSDKAKFKLPKEYIGSKESKAMLKLLSKFK